MLCTMVHSQTDAQRGALLLIKRMPGKKGLVFRSSLGQEVIYGFRIQSHPDIALRVWLTAVWMVPTPAGTISFQSSALLRRDACHNHYLNLGGCRGAGAPNRE